MQHPPRVGLPGEGEWLLRSPTVRLWLPGAMDSCRDLGISDSHHVHTHMQRDRVGTWWVWKAVLSREHPQPCSCSQGPAHLEQVSLALTVDTCEGCINGPLDAPDVADEFRVARQHTCLVQLIEVPPWGKREVGAAGDTNHQHGLMTWQHDLHARERSPRYLGKHKGNRSSGQ